MDCAACAATVSICIPDVLGQLLTHIFVIDERVSFGVSCKYSLGILVAGLISGSLIVRPTG